MSPEKTSPQGVILSRDGRFSDLKLVCQDQEFKVDKRVVCDKSAVFMAECEDGFKESVDNIIHISEFDAETVDRMLDFMYTGEYDDGERQELDAVYTSRNAETNLDETLISSLSSPSAQQPDDNVTDDNVADDNAADDDTSGIPSLETKTMAMKQTLLRNVQVNAIADYYDVSPLKEHANTKIKKILETTWFADDFPEITKKVIESTGDKELHTIMGSTAAKHIEDLVELEDFVALEAMNDFTVGILRRMLSARETREKEFSWTLEDVLSQLESKKSAYDQNLENLRIANMQRDDESARAKDILSNMDDFIRMLSRQKFCRNTNCSQTFGCYVEKYGHLYKPMYRLRCSSCQCRHSV